MNVSGICPNCDSVSDGRFCSTCGQDQQIAPLTFVGMLRQALQEFSDTDGRLIRTVTTLLIRPGRITQDYFRGRRASYLPPFRTYLIASVILYFVLGTLTAQLTFSVDLIDSGTVDAQQADGLVNPGFIAMLDARLDDISNSPRFGERVFAHLPEVGFVLLPFFGLILKLLFFGQRRPYGEHLLAAVHIKTGVFFFVIIAAVVTGLAAALENTAWSAEAVADLAGPLVMLISSIYVGVCLFVIYGGNIFLSIVKTSVLLLSYWVLASMSLIGVAVILALFST